MKRLKEFITETLGINLKYQKNALLVIDPEKLKSYLKIADKFISDEAKSIIAYLIDNDGKINNTDIVTFYNNKDFKDNTQREIYVKLGVLNKKNHLRELPNFQTKEQFESILSKKNSPDAIILDLSSETTRNEIAKQYTKVVYKIARQFVGKSNLGFDELVSAGFDGLILAMDRYGKKNVKGSNEDAEEYNLRVASTTFFTYASYMIRAIILEEIKNFSHIVKIPIIVQNKEKHEKGYNTRNITLSGDRTVSGSDDDNSKTLFDYIGYSEEGGREISREDEMKLWKEVFDILETKFGKKIMEIYYSATGLNGHDQVKKTELAKKYKTSNSNITFYLMKVNDFLKSNPRIMQKLMNIRELTMENLHDIDTDDDIYDSVHISINEDITTA